MGSIPSAWIALVGSQWRPSAVGDILGDHIRIRRSEGLDEGADFEPGRVAEGSLGDSEDQLVALRSEVNPDRNGPIVAVRSVVQTEAAGERLLACWIVQPTPKTSSSALRISS